MIEWCLMRSLLLIAMSMVELGAIDPVVAQVHQTTVAAKDRYMSGYVWADDSVRPKAVLVAIHGGVQNAGCYETLAKCLVPQGILVYSVDLRGHGQWLTQAQTRPRLNYPASTADLTMLVGDLRASYAKLPLYCIGESLGASVALHCVAKHPRAFDGLILASIGTNLNLRHAFPAVLDSARQAAKSLCRSIDLGPHLKRISDDQRSCKEMIDDPRNRNIASLGDLLHMAGFVRQNKALAPNIDKSIPTLVIQGTEDQICTPQSARAVFDRLPVNDKTMKTFQGCGHLLATTAYLKPQVVRTISDWLFVHIKPAKAASVNGTDSSARPNTVSASARKSNPSHS